MAGSRNRRREINDREEVEGRKDAPVAMLQRSNARRVWIFISVDTKAQEGDRVAYKELRQRTILLWLDVQTGRELDGRVDSKRHGR